MTGWRAETARKKERKWSNCSMKKYHEREMFGVRSGMMRLSEKEGQ